MEYWLAASPWIGVILWIIIYTSDYYSTRGFHEIGHFQAEGQISYRKWFSYRISALEFRMFSVLFLMIAILNYSPFFLGGAIACFSISINHNKLAKKARSIPSPTVESPI